MKAMFIRGAGGHRIADRDAPDWLEEVVSIQHSAGASLSELNTRAYWVDRDYGGEELIFPDGYSQVLPALANGLDIRLGNVVKRIDYGASGVELTDSQGRVTRFDAVIVTVSLGVMKNAGLTFHPALPRSKVVAIERLGMGLLDKLYLRFPQVFWDQDVTWIATPDTGHPRGQFNQWLNLAKYIGAPILMAFNGGPPAWDLARLDDADLLRRAFQALDRAYP